MTIGSEISAADEILVSNAIKKIEDKYSPIKTEFPNVFLIGMHQFKSFLKDFEDFDHLWWDNISSSKYYDWDIECLKLGKNVLNWKELIKNPTTRELIRSNDFPKELKKYSDNGLRMLSEDILGGEDISIDEYVKYYSYESESLIIIMDIDRADYYYYQFVQVVEREIRKKLPNIKSVKWNTNYWPLQDEMNNERLKFDIIDADYVFLGDGKEVKKNSDTFIMWKDFALKQNKKVCYSLDELLQLAGDPNTLESEDDDNQDNDRLPWNK